MLQVTQNGSDLWLSYWVSHTHEERIEGALLETAWRNATAAPDATGDWQQHMPWLWLSMAGVQPAGGQVSQCCLWAQSGLSGGGVEHEGNSNSIGSSSVKRTLVAVETEPWGDEEGHLDQQQVTHNAEADQSARGSVVMEEGLRGGLGVRKAAGVAYSAQAAGGGGSLQEPGLRQQWQRLAGRGMAAVGAPKEAAARAPARRAAVPERAAAAGGRQLALHPGAFACSRAQRTISTHRDLHEAVGSRAMCGQFAGMQV